MIIEPRPRSPSGILFILSTLVLALCLSASCTNYSKGDPPACACKDARDFVASDPLGIYCARSDYTCNALSPCDDGYTCHGSECRCEDKDICGIACDGVCGCAGSMVCDPSTSTCRAPQVCIDDSMCPAGQVCREGDAGMVFTCQAPGTTVVGGACDKGSDCMSGVCVTQVCLQSCTRNDDCSQGQTCEHYRRVGMGCTVQSDCDNCTAANMFCDANENECANDLCHTTADCTQGVCSLQESSYGFGRCELVQDGCEPDEFQSFMDERYCVIYQACWTDQDCPAEYDCTRLDQLGMTMPVDEEASICARKIR